MYLNKPVVYLQADDFDQDGKLVNPNIPRDKPVMIMVQALFCGYCTKAKPDFQRFADDNQDKVFCATIEADGSEPGEPELAKKIDQYFPDFLGFPHYEVFKNGERLKSYSDGRDKKSLEAFLATL